MNYFWSIRLDHLQINCPWLYLFKTLSIIPSDAKISVKGGEI